MGDKITPGTEPRSKTKGVASHGTPFLIAVICKICYSKTVMENLQNYVEQLKTVVFWQNSAYDWLLAGLILLGSFFALKIARWISNRFLKKSAAKTDRDGNGRMIKIISEFKPSSFLLLAFCFGASFLVLSDRANQAIFVLFVFVITREAIRALGEITGFAAEKYVKDNKSVSRSFLGLLEAGIKAVLWLFALALVLSNFGFNVTSLLAGLGIGGIALALAVQSVLGDVLSSLSIYFDKPFEEGDFISAGGDTGTVTKIGLKSTRIKTLQGEELVIPNKDLTGSRIQNFQKMKRRRDLFTLGIVYGTHPDKLDRIPKMIEKIISETELAEFDRCHLKEFGVSGLNYEVVYFVNSREYPIFIDKKQEINLKIYRKLKEEGIELAFPTQTVFVKK